MKCHDARMFVDGQVHRRYIAITNKNFRILSYQVIVDSVQNVFRTISAPDGNNRLYFMVGEHRMKVIQSIVNRSKIIAHALVRILCDPHAKTKMIQRLLEEGNSVRIRYCGRWCDQPDNVAFLERRRPNQFTRRVDAGVPSR